MSEAAAPPDGPGSVAIDRAGPVAFVLLTGPIRTGLADELLAAITELAHEGRAVLVDVAGADRLESDVLAVLAGWQHVVGGATVPAFGLIIGNARRDVARCVRTHPLLRRRVPVHATRADALIAIARFGARGRAS